MKPLWLSRENRIHVHVTFTRNYFPNDPLNFSRDPSVYILLILITLPLLTRSRCRKIMSFRNTAKRWRKSPRGRVSEVKNPIHPFRDTFPSFSFAITIKNFIMHRPSLITKALYSPGRNKIFIGKIDVLRFFF